MSLQHLFEACCEKSRRDGAIVAWHEVPGISPSPKGRPVGYGVIRADLSIKSMIGDEKYPLERARTEEEGVNF
jgi:hypothetical protein